MQRTSTQVVLYTPISGEPPVAEQEEADRAAEEVALCAQMEAAYALRAEGECAQGCDCEEGGLSPTGCWW